VSAKREELPRAADAHAPPRAAPLAVRDVSGVPTRSASETVVLGQTGITTSSLVLGCARLGSVLTPSGPRESIAFLQRALSLGIRHFDTASVYGQGESERLIGCAVQGRRGEVCIATKAGQRLTRAQAVAARFKTPLRLLAKHCFSVRAGVAKRRQAGLHCCFEPAFLERSLERSLMRLRTDYVDIFYLHGPPIDVLSRDDVLWCLHRIQRSGKARAFGVSCESADDAAASIRIEGLTIVQASLSPEHAPLDALGLAAQHGKAILLRLGPPPTHAAPAAIGGFFQQRLSAMLRLPAVAGVIVGTTQPRHLEQNVAAWRSALRQTSL
jgi:aryl-alcohol dehydrogenase-like predicted oxidoreductase